MTEVTYNQILVIVDRLSKYTWFYPWREDWGAGQFAAHFMRTVYNEVGCPKAWISDRDSRFTSKYWKTLAAKTGMKLKMSTAYHPQTDGQTERANQTLEQYLRVFVNYEQNDWVHILPLAQIAYNSSVHETTGLSPHFMRFGKELDLYHGQYEHVGISDQGENVAEQWKHLVEDAKLEIEWQNHKRKEYYDKKRQESPTLKKGDKVYILTRKLLSKRPSKKFDWKKLGPYEVLEVRPGSDNVKIKLPKGSKMYPVIHMAYIEPAPTEMRILEKDPDTIQVEPEYEIEKILASRREGGELNYLIRWKNYGQEEDSWEPAPQITSPGIIKRFHRQNPNMPK